MTEWIFQAKPSHFDVHRAAQQSGCDWWNTPHHRGKIAVGDRVWIQVAGRQSPGIYYVAFAESGAYEAEPEDPGRPNFGRWRTDIRFRFHVSPPLSRQELLEDPELAPFRHFFRGFQGSNALVPPQIAARLAVLAERRLIPIESR